MNKIIYQRLKEFVKTFDQTECPFGNSGMFFDEERDLIETNRYKTLFEKYGRCVGLCQKLGFISSNANTCPCLEHGADKSLKILKKWLKKWESTHPGVTATTTSGKRRKSATTTKIRKSTRTSIAGTPKKK